MVLHCLQHLLHFTALTALHQHSCLFTALHCLFTALHKLLHQWFFLPHFTALTVLHQHSCLFTALHCLFTALHKLLQQWFFLLHLLHKLAQLFVYCTALFIYCTALAYLFVYCTALFVYCTALVVFFTTLHQHSCLFTVQHCLYLYQWQCDCHLVDAFNYKQVCLYKTQTYNYRWFKKCCKPMFE